MTLASVDNRSRRLLSLMAGAVLVPAIYQAAISWSIPALPTTRTLHQYRMSSQAVVRAAAGHSLSERSGQLPSTAATFTMNLDSTRTAYSLIGGFSTLRLEPNVERFVIVDISIAETRGSQILDRHNFTVTTPDGTAYTPLTAIDAVESLHWLGKQPLATTTLRTGQRSNGCLIVDIPKGSGRLTYNFRTHRRPPFVVDSTRRVTTSARRPAPTDQACSHVVLLNRLLGRVGPALAGMALARSGIDWVVHRAVAPAGWVLLAGADIWVCGAVVLTLAVWPWCASGVHARSFRKVIAGPESVCMCGHPSLITYRTGRSRWLLCDTG